MTSNSRIGEHSIGPFLDNLSALIDQQTQSFEEELHFLNAISNCKIMTDQHVQDGKIQGKVSKPMM